jgi:hypothetical protein
MQTFVCIILLIIIDFLIEVYRVLMFYLFNSFIVSFIVFNSFRLN